MLVDWSLEPNLRRNPPSADHYLPLRSLETLEDCLEILRSINEELDMLQLPSRSKTFERVALRSLELLDSLSDEIKEFAEYPTIRGKEQQFSMAGFQLDTQLITSFLLPT